MSSLEQLAPLAFRVKLYGLLFLTYSGGREMIANPTESSNVRPAMADPAEQPSTNMENYVQPNSSMPPSATYQQQSADSTQLSPLASTGQHTPKGKRIHIVKLLGICRCPPVIIFN